MNKTQEKNQKTEVLKSSTNSPEKTAQQGQTKDQKSSISEDTKKKETTAQLTSSTLQEQEINKNTDKTTDQKETSEKSTVQKNSKDTHKKEQSQPAPVCLQTLFAYKKGMTHIYNDKNQYVPVTALQYKPCRVTQIKTKEREGYNAVQVALESSKKENKALQNHLKKAGFKNGACFVREVRQALPDNIQVGQEVSIESLKEGDVIRLSSVSKGHGFSGVVKRWGFGGGPASHGAEKHRTTGSIANTATQGRVFPGKKMPGRFGCDRTTIFNVKVIKVAEGFIFVKGSVPGAFQSLVELRK